MGNKNGAEKNFQIKNKVKKVRRSILENDELKQGIISEINLIREIHQVPYLLRNNDIDSIAQSFSNKLSKKGGNLEFSNNKYKGEELGEITFFNELGEINIDSLIDYWYEDEKYFEYNAKNQEATPFAQLVWKDSKQIGIGLSKDNNGCTYIVINFYPSGNVTDQYNLNVFAPKEDIKNRKNKNKNEYSKFELEALKLHNKYRKRHHSPPLILNKELCFISQNYSKKLIQNNKENIEYSFGKYKGNDIGENIFMCQGKDVNLEMAINFWYNECDNYDFQKDFQKGAEHFTQIIWKDTKELGIGISNQGNKTYIVANYYPPGNFLGKYKENILSI